MPAKHKLDIFHVLSKISTKDREFYSKLNEEEQKAVVPLVVMRWLSGTKDMRQIIFLNELVNPVVFSFTRHKELLVNLLTVSTSGRSQRYFWNKANTSKKHSYPTSVGVVGEYYRYSSREAAEALPCLTADDVLDLAEQLGRQPDEIKTIKKEMKDRERASISV